MFDGQFVWTVSGVIDTIALLIVALIGCLLVSVYVMTWIVIKVQVLMCKLGLHKHVTVEDKCAHHRVWSNEDNSDCKYCIQPHEECKRCRKHKVKR